MDASTSNAFRRAILIVLLLNFGYFGIEFAVALSIGSVSLFADSIDFLEDGMLNLLVLMALGWSARNRARIGMLLAGVLLIPALATLWTAWGKFVSPAPPAPVALSLTGAGAMLVNLLCATLLARFRDTGGSLARAAFLSARNDVIANGAIICAGLLTAATLSGWPDLVIGLAIAALHAGAAHEIWHAARAEHRATQA